MRIRQAVGAAAFSGAVAAGAAVLGSDATPAQFEIDGVTVTALNSSDYMPPAPGGDAFEVDGVTFVALNSADYMPPELPGLD